MCIKVCTGMRGLLLCGAWAADVMALGVVSQLEQGGYG